MEIWNGGNSIWKELVAAKHGKLNHCLLKAK